MAPVRTLLGLILAVSLSHAADITTNDGKKSVGDLVSADAKEVVLKTATGLESVEPSKLAAIDFRATQELPASGTWIEVQLIDGSRFRCSDFQVKGKDFVIVVAGSDKEKVISITAPLAALFYMIRDFQDPKVAQKFRGILSKRAKRDIRLFARNKNDPDTIDRVEGTFGEGDATGKKIEFQDEQNQKTSVDVSRITGMILNPPVREIAQTLCRVVDLSKNELYAKSVVVAADRKITFVTTAGVNVEYLSTDSIAKIDFSVGSLRYLSDLEPTKVEETSTNPPAERYRRDRSLDNTDLRIGEQKYAKGLALHSRTVLTYDLGGNYKTFEAVAGVDAIVEGDSSVNLIVEADGKQVLKQKIEKKDAPRLLNLNIIGVKTLRITVESDLFDLFNQVDLADAKLRK